MALKFYNSEKENENYKIEIFGEIGESWFDEGFSIQTLANHLKNSSGKPIDIIINSLGGDVDTAFAVHDILKAYKPKKTVQIIGMTASSATIIAMAGDTVQMSKNALALIHNASTVTMGNADEHRKAVDDLEKVDNIIVGIYREKSGKPKSTFYTAMEKEQWLTASEMKDLGLIDKIIEPRDISNVIIEKINNSHLPKITNQINTDMTAKELTDLFTSFKNEVKDFFKPAETTAADVTVLATERDALQNKINEIEPKILEIENSIATVTTANETLTNSLTERTNQLEAMRIEFANYCQAKGDRTGFVANGGKEEDFVDPNQQADVPKNPGAVGRLNDLVKEAEISVK